MNDSISSIHILFHEIKMLLYDVEVRGKMRRLGRSKSYEDDFPCEHTLILYRIRCFIFLYSYNVCNKARQQVVFVIATAYT